MNEKLNVQNLIDSLAERHGMSKKDADGFVKDFFQLIEEALEQDKYVKVKGLGTFKLIEVGSRESINVNTGERFEIEGHTKVTFTPEPALKEIINKPFSHFETVVLNEKTVLEDTLVENEELREVDEISEETEIKKEPLEKNSGQPTTETPSEMEVKKEVVASSEETTKADKSIAVEEISSDIDDSEEIVESQSVERTSETLSSDQPILSVPKSGKDASTMRYFIGVIIFIVVLCGGAIVFTYYPDLFERITTPPAENKLEEPIKPSADQVLKSDTIKAEPLIEPVKVDTVAESVEKIPHLEMTSKESLPAVKKVEKKVAVPFKPDSVGYVIVGTEAVYTVKEGETLTRIAFRFYGTKALWPYIVKHNIEIIKDPDNVPYGTKLKIPKLEKKQ